MATPRTRREVECLQFISRFVDANGFSPTYEQIALGMGYTSRSTAFGLVDGLEARGLLTRSGPASRRSIEVISRVPTVADYMRLSDADFAEAKAHVLDADYRRSVARALEANR